MKAAIVNETELLVENIAGLQRFRGMRKQKTRFLSSPCHPRHQQPLLVLNSGSKERSQPSARLRSTQARLEASTTFTPDLPFLETRLSSTL
jgi:hypothetical protein